MDKVLVVQVYTHHKEYCRWMYPKFANTLTYKNKTIVLVDERQYPELNRCATGEERAALGRQIGIEIARKGDYDWLFMMDLDVEPDPDIIEKMLACNYPLVGGMHAARGNANMAIGHNYNNHNDKERSYLTRGQLVGTPEVDDISGGILLVARGIFMRVDYTGYIGPNTIPLRYTADDEYLLIKIYESLKIRPVVATNAKSWHYSDDGRAYRLWSEVKQWKKY